MRRRRLVERLVEKWPINFDESATSLWRNYDESTTKLRQKMTNKFWWICDVADWSKMTNKFWWICDVAAMSQNGRKWPVNFDESTTSQRRYSTNLVLLKNCSTHDWYLLTGGSVSSLSPSRMLGSTVGIFYSSVKGTLLQPISLGEKLKLKTSQFRYRFVAKTSLRRRRFAAKTSHFRRRFVAKTSLRCRSFVVDSL